MRLEMKVVSKILFAALAVTAVGCASSSGPMPGPTSGPAPGPSAEPLVHPVPGPSARVAAAADPRVGLGAGWTDAEVAASGMQLIAHLERPEGFADLSDLKSFSFANTDIAFAGDLLFMGSYHGFNIYDISDPAQPRLRTSYVCPGGQGDLSIHGDLMFMSVETPDGRIDCGTDAPTESVSA